MTARLRKDIEELKKTLLSLGALVEDAVRLSVKAIEDLDAEVARQVIQRDIEIDRLEVEFEEEALKVLALHQPVAGDLRYIVAMLKINNDLERIGDQAVNLASCAADISSLDRLPIPFEFPAMAEKAREMLKWSLDSFVNVDAALAHRVMDSDDEVDDMNREMYARVEDAIRKYPDRLHTLILYSTVSRNLERIADLATNIAEDVIYLVEGDIIRHRSEEFKK